MKFSAYEVQHNFLPIKLKHLFKWREQGDFMARVTTECAVPRFISNEFQQERPTLVSLVRAECFSTPVRLMRS